MQYTYKCNTCNHEFTLELTLKQAMRSHKYKCPKCRKSTRRLINAPAIRFKGAGFYSTDNKNGKSE